MDFDLPVGSNAHLFLDVTLLAPAAASTALKLLTISSIAPIDAVDPSGG